MGSSEDRVELAELSEEKVESSKREQRAVAFECPSDCDVEHVVIFRPWFMRPWLWSQLPDELLELVIARLPVAQIDGLRALSKSWRFNMAPHSHFKRLCAEARPKLFALMRADPQRGKIRFKLFDSRSYMWHNCEYNLAREYRQSLSVSDGGLVCFVPGGQQLPILVCNPLTNDWRALPLPSLVRHKPRMIQLLVGSGSYRLILVGALGPDRLGAEVYDSSIQKWEILNHGSISGYVDYRMQFDGHNPSRGESLSVYDCSKRLLTGLDCCEGIARLQFSAALKDRVFVLDPAGHEIVELQGPEYMDSRRTIKIPKQTRRGYSLDLNYGVHTALHACNGLLLVTEGAGFASKHPEKEWRVGYGHRFYLYDMGRGTWWSLPTLEKEYDVFAYNARDVSEALMCKLNWWARP